MFTAKIRPIICLVLLLAVASCSQDDRPTEIPQGTAPVITTQAPLKALTSGVVISNYAVQFDGRNTIGSNTVFTWTVQGTGVEPALSHFMIQLPACAPEPLSFSPSNSVSINTNPNTGIYGVEWHLSVDADDFTGRQYSITFPGDVPMGEVYSSVISGNETGVGVIPGPCQGYDISGRVFVDANQNGLRDPDEESGIANVVVELVSSSGQINTTTTDPFGDYNFRKLSGTFTVNLPLMGYAGFFNADLNTSFDLTTDLSYDATVPPDALDNDFGFSPQTAELIFDLESGVLLTDGASLKFWKSEFRTVTGKGGGKSIYDAATLTGFLAEIQDLFLANPYVFTPGNELQDAFDILRSNSKESIDELLAELLATELNQVSGRGLIGQEDLHLVLISWGEALVAETLSPVQLRAAREPSALDAATDLFGLINTGGGGGVDE